MLYKSHWFRINGFTLKRAVSSFLVLVPFIFPCSSLAESGGIDVEKANLSDEYSMKFHASAKEKIGEAEYNEISNFFHKAEMAIETEDLESLMALYSERYRNLKKRDKKFAEEVWTKIFANFDNLSAKHMMKLSTYEKRSEHKLAVTECSGLLVGTPNGADRPVTIDSWDNQMHILINEGSWKLFGNAGEAVIRYGEDDVEIHPLF